MTMSVTLRRMDMSELAREECVSPIDLNSLTLNLHYNKASLLFHFAFLPPKDYRIYKQERLRLHFTPGPL